jgi:hypothetical protein
MNGESEIHGVYQSFLTVRTIDFCEFAVQLVTTTARVCNLEAVSTPTGHFHTTP